jgi:hypothetical protein
LSFIWDPSGIASTPFSSPVLLDASLRNTMTLSSGKYSGSHRSWSSFSYTKLVKQMLVKSVQNCESVLKHIIEQIIHSENR